MSEILQFSFMRHALMVGLLVSIACGIVGTYVVVKRIVFISGGISHTAYGGVGLGYLVGIPPMVGATVFTVLAALAMGEVSHRVKQREDTIIGMMWAVGMALGVIFVKLSPGYTGDLMSYLFGSILAVPLTDLYLILALNVVILLIVILYHDQFTLTAFDEEFAQVIGVNTRLYNQLLLVVIALTVVVMIRAVGIILVIALLTIPPATATLFTRSMTGMMAFSMILSAVFTTGGLVISYLFDLPSGATIIILCALGYMVGSLLAGRKTPKAVNHRSRQLTEWL
ncbi:MAG TPA: metal ABC transporter permease [Syntrophomonadaceae bacterium]|nr:metal ABC transporter permease [Syntrophomonadaceae bacterium]HQD90366.1 metal ABC transporter permease [Syntrophomonadaceae bacterium]